MEAAHDVNLSLLLFSYSSLFYLVAQSTDMMVAPITALINPKISKEVGIIPRKSALKRT